MLPAVSIDDYWGKNDDDKKDNIINKH
jgi:hypothetical protein